VGQADLGHAVERRKDRLARRFPKSDQA
jgi:hypothetical protein